MGNGNICASKKRKWAREWEREKEKEGEKWIKMSKMNVKCGKVLCAQTKENKTKQQWINECDWLGQRESGVEVVLDEKRVQKVQSY